MIVLFFIIATFYSSVGFGGGSSYIAVLALFDFPYQTIPVLALICNIIVVMGGAFHFYRNGHFRWGLFWPYALTSIPMSFLGGRVPISRSLFLTLLGISLLGVGIRLLFSNRIQTDYLTSSSPRVSVALLIGGLLGLLSGLVGIGGGIFLAPVLLVFKWGKPKEVAAVAAFFILLNSFSGLIGQLIKGSSNIHLLEHWPLFVAVFLGSQLGSRLGSGAMASQRVVQNLTALLVLFVGVRVLFT